MRPRAELGISAGLLLGLGLLAVALGSRRTQPVPDESPRSTYLTGPGGASAFAEGAARLGVKVERHRRPTAALAAPRATSGRELVAVLGPSVPLTAAEAVHLLDLPVDLLLAGSAAATAMRCLGYQVAPRQSLRSSGTRAPLKSEDRPAPRVWATLVPQAERRIVDSAGYEGRKVACDVPTPARVDTLLATRRGRAVVIRLTYTGDKAVTLVADDRLFRNRAMRLTSAGTQMLALVAPRYRRMVVDEYHHGYQDAGSLSGAALSWSTRSPWGWLVWQLAAVGVIALLASGIRFGPVRIGDRAPAPLADGARARAGHRARRRSRTRRRGALDDPGAAPPALARGARDARSRNVARRARALGAHPTWP